MRETRARSAVTHVSMNDTSNAPETYLLFSLRKNLLDRRSLDERKRRLDLLDLRQYSGIVGYSSIESCEDYGCFVVVAFLDEPSRRFREGEDESDQAEAEDDLTARGSVISDVKYERGDVQGDRESPRDISRCKVECEIDLVSLRQSCSSSRASRTHPIRQLLDSSV